MLQEAEAAKEVAEQCFWLPLERSKGRRMGELCVSLLFTKVSCVCLELRHKLFATCCSILTVCLLCMTLQCPVELAHMTSSSGHQQMQISMCCLASILTAAEHCVPRYALLKSLPPVGRELLVKL